MAGRYRGVPNSQPQGVRKRRLLDRLAAVMRDKYLNTGSGCKTRAKAIAAREGR